MGCRECAGGPVSPGMAGGVIEFARALWGVGGKRVLPR